MSFAVPNHMFCVGAQKAGTTWLYDYFSAHPEVHVPSVKEMHYFNVLYDPRQAGFYHDRRRVLEVRRSKIARGEVLSPLGQPGDVGGVESLQLLVKMHEDARSDHSLYRDFVSRGSGDVAWTADITPDYCVLGGECFQAMLKAFPEAKFLYIMRDPIERTWSHLQMHLKQLRSFGQSDVTIDQLVSRLLLGKENHVLGRSNYPGTLFALGHLPKDRVKYMFYETLFSDHAMLELCNFLNVGFKSGDYGRRIRAGSEVKMSEDHRMTFRWLLASVYRRVYASFGDAIPRSWDLSAMDAERPDFLDVSKISPHVMSKAG